MRTVIQFQVFQGSVKFSARRPSHIIINNNDNNNKKRTYRIVDFAVPGEHRVILKESEKRNKYPGIAWDGKNLRT